MVDVILIGMRALYCVKVLEKSLISNLDLIGNASSVHSEGREAKNIIESSRDDIMDLLGLNSGTIIFTSGASESAALFLHNKKISCSAIEHDCVKMWCDVSIPVMKNGLVSLTESKTIRHYKLLILRLVYYKKYQKV